MQDEIRAILARSGRLAVPVENLEDEADLFAAGLDSLAIVTVLMSIEERFDIELPDELLSRRSFSSIGTITACGGRADREQLRPMRPDAGLGAVCSASGIAAEHADTVDRESCIPSQAIAALRREELFGAMVPRQLGGQQYSLSQIAGVTCSLVPGITDG